MPKDIPQETVELPEEEVTQPVEKMMEKPNPIRLGLWERYIILEMKDG